MPTANSDRQAAAELIGGRYRIDLARKLPGFGGGLATFAAADQAGGPDAMAVQVERARPARAAALTELIAAPVPGLLNPLAHGPAPLAGGGEAQFVICQMPPGPALSVGLQPWPESELLEHVLRPAVRTLEGLWKRGLTHRAIRPDNLFRLGPDSPAVLGCAWAAPPASLQPALFEPPYAAMCLPHGRGDGRTADDVYALGVTLLVLALGGPAAAALDDAAMLRRKLERGSYTAIAGEERVPPAIADLVRGMLAEDPEHRPPLTLLADPAAARARRVAARPPRRAQRPIEVAGETAWDARALAHALAAHPEDGLAALHDGAVDRWLRRGIGDAGLAGRIEERLRELTRTQVGEAADALQLMHAVAALDPLAPLCWRGANLWPDGIGPALAVAMAGDPPVAKRLLEMVEADAMHGWAAARPERCNVPALRLEARTQRSALQAKGPGGGPTRLLYLLNPLLPCASPVLQGRSISRIQDLLPALDAAAARGTPGESPLIDAHVASFVAMHTEEPIERDLLLAGDAGALARLRMLARLQTRFRPHPLSGLGRWMLGDTAALVETWHNRARRGQVEERLRALAEAGEFAAMLKLLDDPAARAADEKGVKDAEAALARTDAELRRIDAGEATRASLSARIGQEIAVGSGLATLAAALAFAALG